MTFFLKKCLLLFSTFLLFLHPIKAQLQDDFSDGNFTENPVWSGKEECFQVNADYVLQLNAPEAGKAYLSTENERIFDTEWRFFIHLNFSPSSNNFARIYLTSNQQDLQTPLNGYFLQFGEPLSNDAIELYRQNGLEETLICRGTEGMIASKFSIRVKVIHSISGDWKIFADTSGGDMFTEIASGTDATFVDSRFFGIFCQYTIGNANRFFFDDFYIGDEIVDNEPPKIEKINPISNNSVEVVFNEAVTSESASNIEHYQIQPNHLHPTTALLQNNRRTVLLSFNFEFAENQPYTIIIQNISDLAGNVAPLLSEDFMYIIGSYSDIVINEILADPTPAVGLPEWEYIELYNRTNTSIDLTGWMLTIGTVTKTFSNTSIAALGYLILCHEDALSELSQYGNAFPILSSKTVLINSGQSLILRNPKNTVISQITYSDNWYQDDLKKQGGWSLEQIDPNNYCGTIYNWTASIDSKGGTPGEQNSVFAENPETEKPLLLRAEFLNSHQITVFFSKPMNALTVTNVDNWNIDGGLQIAGIFPIEPDYLSTHVIFTTPLIQHQIYTLSVVTENVTDCSGMSIEKNASVQFAIPEPIEKGDIVINEILHHPNSDGVQYVELFNRSNKVLDIKYLRFIFEKTSGQDSTHCSLPSFLLFPQSFCVLTKSPTIVEMQYNAPFRETLITVSNFPTLTFTEGIVRIAALKDITQEIDAMRYSDKMHAALLATETGVALERINPERSSNDETNWHSASELSGFGTPGYQNSQFDNNIDIDNTLVIDPEIFTPNNDGYNDYLNIRYQFDEVGYTMNVYIFDVQGVRVRHLINNELCGTEGAFSWDGKNEQGQLCNAGIYIIYTEIFDLKGSVKRYKKIGTLGVKF